MKLDKKSIIVAVAGVLILGAVLIIAYKSKNSELKKNSVGQFITREVISDQYEVPEKDTTGLPENIARPVSTLPTNAKTDAKKVRIFNLTIENDKFIPDTVIINDWDSLVLYVTAIDKDYDFTQPDISVSQKIVKGERVVIKHGFGAEGVKLIFFCASCGGPTKGPVGQILSVPRSEPQ